MDKNKVLAEDMDKFPNEMSYRGKAHQQLVTDKDGKAHWKDQLAYSELTEISWDGDTTDRVNAASLYKVSDLTPNKEDVIGGTYKYGSEIVTITQDRMIESSNDGFLIFSHKAEQPVILISFIDNLDINGYLFPEKGIYMYSDEYSYINSLTYGHISRFAYDYMPEGYPKKEITPFTLMKEQEISFSDNGKGSMDTGLLDVLDIKEGEKVTVIWDGISYEETVREASLWDIESGIGRESLIFGNLGLIKPYTDITDCPFVYEALSSGQGRWTTSDTSVTHTIKIICDRPVYTPMDINFLPKNFNVIFTDRLEGPMSCNFTYNQIREWIENDLPIVAIYRYSGDAGRDIIISYEIGEDYITFFTKADKSDGFKYHSDGTFGEFTPA